MPGSNKTERNRQLKANRDAGLGDEMGRLPSRVKDAGAILTCEVCKAELKCTKCKCISYIYIHHNMNISCCYEHNIIYIYSTNLFNDQLS